MHGITKFFILILFIFSYLCIYAEESNQLKVYINSESIDFDFLREHINYVDYVYDPQSCDVQIILLKQDAANGGYKYAIQFIGKKFNDIDSFILNTTILPNDSEDIERKKLIRTIKAGIFPFINEKDQFNNIDIIVKSNSSNDDKTTLDRWKSWVFNINGSGSFYKEEQSKDYSYIGKITASQIKKDFKIENKLYSYTAMVDNTDGYNITVKVNQYSTKAVFSINDHWSAGFATQVIKDTRKNIKLSTYLKPAIEYNVFPWTKSNKIFLTGSYTIGPKYNKYNRLTKYNKTKEFLWDQTAYIKFLTKQTWGQALTMITAQNYLNQPDKYSIGLDAEALFYISKGFSLSISFTAEDVNNQLYIPDDGYTYAEKYLGSAVRETGYYLIGSIGLSFRFGSLTNNVVNRRL